MYCVRGMYLSREDAIRFHRIMWDRIAKNIKDQEWRENIKGSNGSFVYNTKEAVLKSMAKDLIIPNDMIAKLEGSSYCFLCYYSRLKVNAGLVLTSSMCNDLCPIRWSSGYTNDCTDAEYKDFCECMYNYDFDGASEVALKIANLPIRNDTPRDEISKDKKNEEQKEATGHED